MDLNVFITIVTSFHHLSPGSRPVPYGDLLSKLNFNFMDNNF
jgi:hypothetical protein